MVSVTERWRQDSADYSWTLVDDEDCFYRAASSVDGDCVRRWVIAWTETFPRVRVCIGGSYATAEEAKAAIERIAIFAVAREQREHLAPTGSERSEHREDLNSISPPPDRGRADLPSAEELARIILGKHSAFNHSDRYQPLTDWTQYPHVANALAKAAEILSLIENEIMSDKWQELCEALGVEWDEGRRLFVDPDGNGMSREVARKLYRAIPKDQRP